MILILSGRSSLYITNSRTFKILKNPSFIKSNLLLGLIIYINIIFIFGILCIVYTLSLFLKVSPQTLFLIIHFFITLLKNIKFYRSFFYNSWILSTIITICGTNSSHFLVFNKTLALNPLFIKNRVLLVVLYSKVLYVIILIGNNLI